MSVKACIFVFIYFFAIASGGKKEEEKNALAPDRTI